MENALLTHRISVYQKAGWSMFPVRTKSKEPLIPWKEYQTRKASLEEIQEWLKKWPEMNLGIVTGNISALVVVDLDGEEGRIWNQSKRLVSSVTAKTGNGKQLFYKWNGHVDNSASKIAPGVDIRGDGGFVVVPPSIHPNGKRYRWERFVPAQLLATPSQFLLKEFVSVVPNIVGKEAGWKTHERLDIAKALEEMKIGNIDNTLTSILGRLRHDNYNREDAYRLLEPHALAAGATPGHLEEKIKNIWSRYESKQTFNGTELYQQSNGNLALSIHSPTNDDSFNKYNTSLQRHSQSDFKTGFPTLDKFFEGSLKSERPFVVAARTGTGKTNFGIALSYNLCKQGKKVLYFSTEFKYNKIWNWYIPYCRDIEEFRSHIFYVCDSFNPNIEQIEKALIEYKPDVFVFDYIQHLGKDKDLLSQFMHGCQFLQQKYNTQAVVLAQLNRYADGRDEKGKAIEPRMSMIEGSATIEQTASRVLLLSTVKDDIEKKEIQGILDKNDAGDTGIITFALMKHPFLFKEIDV